MAAMQGHTVPNRHFVFKNGRKLTRARMQHAIVLNIGPIADTYVEHVATSDGAEPNRSLLAHMHVANHLGAVGNEGSRMNLRMYISEWSDHFLSQKNEIPYLAATKSRSS